MKILKYFLLLLVVILVVGLIYVTFQPSDYNVSRSKIIKAPITNVFDAVNDMKTWEEWGPWHDEDSTIVVTYGEATSGIGASNTWTSKDGSGSIETVNLVPNKLIEQKMQFNSYDPSDVIWKFKKVDGGTKVTWQMKEEGAPFMFKLFAVFSGGWDSMLGSMLESGLNNLEKVILREVKFNDRSFTIDEVIKTEFDTKKFIGYYHKGKIEEVGHVGMTKLFIQDMPKAGVYATKNGLKTGDVVAGYLYTRRDQKTKEAEFYIGMLLNKALKPDKGMKSITIPKGKAVMISKIGDYGEGDFEAHAKITKYIEVNKLEATGLVLKLYIDNPELGTERGVQTDIYYLVK